jgi:hypothetical protein
MEFKSTLDKGDSDIYHWYFPVPSEIGDSFINGRDRGVICTVNGKEKYHCAIHGDGQGAYIIMLNRQRCKKLGLVKGQSFTVELQKDTSEYGVPMSEELREVLDQMPDADEHFHKMTKGKQRTLIYWVQNVKSSEIKIRRALVMTNHIEELSGDVDYKLLNVQMKEANQASKRS